MSVGTLSRPHSIQSETSSYCNTNIVPTIRSRQSAAGLGSNGIGYVLDDVYAAMASHERVCQAILLLNIPREDHIIADDKYREPPDSKRINGFTTRK